MATVSDILNIMNEIAPPALADDWDNPGLLVGRADGEVSSVLLCVDATAEVVDEARQLSAQLIISHHPLMFRAIKHVRDDEPEGHVICELIRSGISLIAAHTNLDAAAGGVNDALAHALGLKNVEAPEPFLRAGDICGTLLEISHMVRARLDTRALTYGPDDMLIDRAALCSGAGGSEVMAAYQSGAQLFITGEMKHHLAIQAEFIGLNVIEAGHYETERIVLPRLIERLQREANDVQYRLTLSESPCLRGI